MQYGRQSLIFLLVLLVFTQLCPLNAVPSSRTNHLLQESQDSSAYEDIHQEMMTLDTTEQEFLNGRMDLENHDYQGPGPNTRHTPRPPPMG